MNIQAIINEVSALIILPPAGECGGQYGVHARRWLEGQVGDAGAESGDHKSGDTSATTRYYWTEPPNLTKWIASAKADRRR